jgi:hypothetical protein
LSVLRLEAGKYGSAVGEGFGCAVGGVCAAVAIVGLACVAVVAVGAAVGDDSGAAAVAAEVAAGAGGAAGWQAVVAKMAAVARRDSARRRGDIKILWAVLVDRRHSVKILSTHAAVWL